MKLKKLLAAVTAAALAVSTMAVTSFTASAASLSAAPGGDETVLYTVDLSSVKSTFTKKWEDGQWTQIGISDATIMTDPNVYVKATMSGIGDIDTDDGPAPIETIMSWGWGGYSSWVVGMKWYNNTADGAFECTLIPIPTSTSSNAIAYAPISDLALTSWGGIAGNLQCGSPNGLTVSKLEIIRVGPAPEPDPTGVWIKKSDGVYYFKAEAAGDDPDWSAGAAKPAPMKIPYDEILAAGKTVADVKSVTATVEIGEGSGSGGCLYGKISEEDTQVAWKADTTTVTFENADDFSVVEFQVWYAQFGDTCTVTFTLGYKDGEEPGEFKSYITPSNVSVEVGKETTVKLKWDENYPERLYSWRIVSSDENIADAIKNNYPPMETLEADITITGKSVGTATITHYFEEYDVDNVVTKSYEATCTVTVTESGTTPPVVDPTPDDPTPPTPDDPTHTHTPATVWSNDAANHWHTCSGCTDKLDLAAHTSDSGTVTTPATATTTGTKTYKCTVCGYVVKTETIPATGTGDTPAPAPAVPDHNYTGGVVIPVMNNNGTNSNTPVISGDSGKSGWDAIGEAILTAPDGDKIEVTMNGSTKVPSSIFNAVKDKDVDIVFNMGRGLKWTVNGLSVTKASNINFDFSKNTRHIPDEVVDAAEGSYKKQLSLDHNGNFGFAAVMTYDIGARYNGSYANLFYYNSKSKELELIDCSLISGGKASFVLTHASDYLITITEEPLGDFEDVSAASGISSDSTGANAAVFAAVLAVITAAFGVVVYKKRRHN